MTLDNTNWPGPGAGSRLLVAGGSGGIGREVVRQALGHGLEVAVMDLPEPNHQHRIDSVHYIDFDARDPVSIEAATDKLKKDWGSLDAFVYLCGYPILPRKPLAETPLQAWLELMAVNLTSAHLLCSQLLPLFHQAKNPSIVTVASSLAYQVMPGMGAYAASKGGLISLTKALAAEYAPRIRVNAVAPGAVETAFLAGGTGREGIENDRSWFDGLKDKYIANIPLARTATPQDVAGPVFFLCGASSQYMTGQVLHLNGGRLTP